MAPRERPDRSDALTFYAGLEPFTEFAEVADPARYVAAPDDWIVVLADIKGSTEAARAGATRMSTWWGPPASPRC